MGQREEVLSPPFLKVTPTDHGAWVILSSCILLILTVIVVLVTLISRARVLRKLVLCDLYFCLLRPYRINFACSNGLGRHPNALSEKLFQSFAKFFYASQILAIASLACSKVALALLIIYIKPLSAVLYACRCLIAAIAAWGVTGIIALAAQCDPPRPWDFSDGRCVNQQALYTALDTLSIITDIALIILPFFLVFQVQLPTRKRLTIVSFFCMRIFVPLFTIFSLASQNQYFSSRPLDKTWHAVRPTIWAQATLCISIITTCIPSLKRVMADLQTGLMAGRVTEFLELSISGGSNSATAGQVNNNSGQKTTQARRSLTTVYGAGTIDQNSGKALHHYEKSGQRIRKGYRNSILLRRGADPKNKSLSGGAEKNDEMTKQGEPGQEERTQSMPNPNNAIVQTIGYEVRYDREGEQRESNDQLCSGADHLHHAASSQQ
ncbi:conserved hypothetical protein [Histoplasma capsulatum G186AR]|uniref:Rhodopsin domain-containing protein n=1 Tax=Ajellomyces capsulatus (strain G186AR / H82 / ATCC MYA-2454 / RMSCC 2432) TaxID=447093 RepID=C0NT12_AJECG|nr:uncharacterized protein HCBG_06292 [Histoplasma capsulatum G186AR]EEH05173.1 conserved hypothetical protein [Histoplasma capsulatum G186AR]